MKPKKLKLSFEEKLLLNAFKRAQSLWSFNKIRTRGEILKQAFGINCLDADKFKKEIPYKEINVIYENELKLLKEKQEKAKQDLLKRESPTLKEYKEGEENKEDLQTTGVETPKVGLQVIERISPYNPKPEGQT